MIGNLICKNKRGICHNCDFFIGELFTIQTIQLLSWNSKKQTSSLGGVSKHIHLSVF
jgi:hypothetical protein